MRASWRNFFERAKAEFRTLRCIAAHPGTPRRVKVLAGALVAYALSPIDLIPDFIPVLGHLDEAVILPLGVWILLRLTPEEIVRECRTKSGAAQP
jgi:uncharacterized membrane protein YkvA (DUF1232 family)